MKKPQSCPKKKRRNLNSHGLINFKNLMEKNLNASTEYVSDFGISQK